MQTPLLVTKKVVIASCLLLGSSLLLRANRPDVAQIVNGESSVGEEHKKPQAVASEEPAAHKTEGALKHDAPVEKEGEHTSEPHSPSEPSTPRAATTVVLAEAADAIRSRPITPEEIKGVLKLASDMTERGDFKSAEIAYYQMLRNASVPEASVKDALFGLGRMHRKQGSLTKAVAVYEKYLKTYRADDRVPDAMLELGRTLRSLGVYKLAISRFYSVIESTLKLAGPSVDRYKLLTKTAQYEIAETHFQSGNFAEAAKFFSRIRLLDISIEDRARAHFKCGYSQRLQGDIEASITTLRSYIDQNANDENIPEARYLLAISLRDVKRGQEAFSTTLDLLKTEQSKLSSNPKRWSYWQRRTGNQLANDFFESGNTPQAKAIYSALIDLSNEPSWRLPLFYQVALCSERLGNPKEARDALKSVVEGVAVLVDPPVAFTELANMAKWRLEHIGWSEKNMRTLSDIFDTTTGQSRENAKAM